MLNKNNNIVVLGTGFVGNNLYNELLQRGYKNTKNLGRLDLDLSVEYNVSSYFYKNHKNIDVIVVTSALVGGIKANIHNQYDFLLQNLLIQNNVISACVQYDIKLLCLGSSCIFPKDYKQPLKEEYLLDAPLEPSNEGYALAKIVGLKLSEYANKEKNANIISLMPSNLYGPNDNFDLETSHVLSSITRKIVDAKDNGVDTVTILGTGNPRREFLYIDDLSDAIIWGLNSFDNTETFLNVGTGNDISINELAYMISGIVGYNGKFVFDDSFPDGMLMKKLDVSKINKLGWKATTSFEYGLTKTIKYYMENK